MSAYIASQEPEFAAFIGLDWGDRHHHWGLQPADANHPTDKGQLENTPEATELWPVQLSHPFAGRRIAVPLEQQRGAIANMLSRHAHLVLFAVPPSIPAAYRQAY